MGSARPTGCKVNPAHERNFLASANCRVELLARHSIEHSPLLAHDRSLRKVCRIRKICRLTEGASERRSISLDDESISAVSRAAGRAGGRPSNKIADGGLRPWNSIVTSSS